MKIAIIGYGKMGHAVEKSAFERGHEVVCTIDAGQEDKFGSAEFRSADVAIEFTSPATAAANIVRSVKAGVPVVSGSTGWYGELPEVSAEVEKAGSGLLYASNFSIGVYVTRLVSDYLARLMEHLPEYDCLMNETHHVHKLDAPSGTAITLAEGIVKNCPRYKGYKGYDPVFVDPENADKTMEAAQKVAEEIGATPEDMIPVLSYRDGEVPGTHEIEWESAVDSITLVHEAKGRQGFALGAVTGAEWLNGRKGVYGIDDFMGELLK